LGLFCKQEKLKTAADINFSVIGAEMNTFLTAFLVGESFLLCFLLYFHPLKQNAKANKWLSLFAFILGTAFVGNYIDDLGLSEYYTLIIKWINSLQFLLAPSIYISILYFVNPTSKFKIRYWLHFLPFVIFAVIENVAFVGKESISTKTLFEIGETAFWVRDILPFQLLAYLLVSYRTLVKHNKNLQLITAATQKINLNWLKLLLLISIFPVLFWINDALGIFPILVNLNRFIYSISIFFLAYFAMKQVAIFPFENKELEEIAEVLSEPNETIKPNRLSSEQIVELSAQLDNLMKNDKIFLDNEINLTTVAEKLGVSIHDTSFLINEVTGSNFYNFINRHRVEEAKKLLTSGKMDKLNMLGIAFESGFNSKTTFNTAFKKMVGLSPSEYAKQQKNP
jgi:AraC-like DNA-binding protein